MTIVSSNEPAQEPEQSEESNPINALSAPVGVDDDSEDMDFGLDDDSEDEVKALNDQQQSKNALASLNHDDLFAAFNPEDEEDAEEDAFNDPSISHLDEPPLLGGRGRDTSLFGNRAATPVGRATSPRLYAQAAQFPTCSQLRVWKWENGIPVGLGAIDSMATEEDLVLQFFEAMPRRGEGRLESTRRVGGVVVGTLGRGGGGRPAHPANAPRICVRPALAAHARGAGIRQHSRLDLGGCQQAPSLECRASAAR